MVYPHEVELGHITISPFHSSSCFYHFDRRDRWSTCFFMTSHEIPSSTCGGLAGQPGRGGRGSSPSWRGGVRCGTLVDVHQSPYYGCHRVESCVTRNEVGNRQSSVCPRFLKTSIARLCTCLADTCISGTASTGDHGWQQARKAPSQSG